MTSHETRSTQSARNKITSEQNDLKKLKSKHSAKLPTLKVLFSEWSDDDLLFVLEEANGDLDLAIDRISEGHANQWGEVKTKKSKKEAQKAKAATVPLSLQQTSSIITSYSPKPSAPPRTSNERANRPSKAPATSNRPRKANTSWDNKQQESSASLGGSWANIASTKGQNDTNHDSWSAANINDNWATSGVVQNDNEEDTNDDQPKTWASLLKSKPKVETDNVNINETPSITHTQDSKAPVNADNAWNTPATSNDSWNATNFNANTTTATQEWNVDSWNAQSDKPETDERSATVNAKESTPTENSKEQEKQHEETTTIKEGERLSNSRLHNQEEPVVLPSSDVTELNVKFGTLHVEDEPKQTTIKETTVIEEKVKESINEALPSIPGASATAPKNDSDLGHTYSKQQEVPITASNGASAPASTNSAYHQGLPQQGFSQQQPFGIDNLTSSYNSYLPNQPHTGLGSNPTSNTSDYNAYNNEAQRAAAMGYYDPTAFSHQSPATSSVPYQTREKYVNDATGQIPSTQNQSVPQQMYPTNLPYYQYYYMPNQYNAYQQSPYGQHFMNKGMYPNMYQQSSASPAKASTTNAVTANAAQSPYGSPYGQQTQLYSQSVNGYDDLGLNDYQKTIYGQQQHTQLHGFLGQLGQQQTSQAANTQSTQSAQQSDTRNTNLSSNPTTQAPTGQHQTTQQQASNHPYTNNFFGQPQMFSYQQYPQYQQQVGYPQATTNNRHQQQYWNQ
ncbi:hypothetical protein BY458DRAFT_488013 [Sporodiniella umbellata]|nr:hypothetical protein BY458DRAFT_488013 [Sporodiniella umbellata]